jgi:hypothetical protein
MTAVEYSGMRAMDIRRSRPFAVVVVTTLDLPEVVVVDFFGDKLVVVTSVLSGADGVEPTETLQPHVVVTPNLYHAAPVNGL